MSSRSSRWRRVRKGLISIFIVSLAGVVVFLVARIPTPVQETPLEEPVVVNVEVWAVDPVRQMPDLLELPAATEPGLVVNVPVEQKGRIEEILVEEGQPVREGDVILRLDATLLDAEYERARVQSEFDERSYRRSLDLLERGVLNRNEVEALEARAIVSRADFVLARTNLERATVLSPVTGVLNDLFRERGEYVSAGDTVAQIVVVDRLKVAVKIPERDIRFLRLGMPIEVTVDALEGVRVPGRVTYISELADEATRTTRVDVTVDNTSRRLRAGMIVRVRISRQVLRDVVMIPLDSVIPLEDGRIVYVVSDGRAERREIALGMIRGSRVQVLDGLSAGELLIVKGQRQVGPGQSVRIIQQG